MPNRVPAVHYTEARRSSMRTLSSSDDVSRRREMHRACALNVPLCLRVSLARETLLLPSPTPISIIFSPTFSVVRESINQPESVFCVDILMTLEGTREASFFRIRN